MKDFLSERARLSLLGSKALALRLLSIPAVPSCLLTHAQDNCRRGHGTFLTHGMPESSEGALPPTSRLMDMVLGGRERHRIGPSRPFHAWLARPAPHCLQRPVSHPLLSTLPGGLQQGTCGVSVAHPPSSLIGTEPWAVSLTGIALGKLMTRDAFSLGFSRSGCGGPHPYMAIRCDSCLPQSSKTRCGSQPWGLVGQEVQKDKGAGTHLQPLEQCSPPPLHRVESRSYLGELCWYTETSCDYTSWDGGC